MKPETARTSPQNGALTPKQEAAALALASGYTQDQAAQSARCGIRTIKTWLHDLTSFSGRIQELRAEMTSRALGRMMDGMTTAADTLGRLLNAKSESVRLGACRAILELGVKLRESVETEERIAALEAKLGRGK